MDARGGGGSKCVKPGTLPYSFLSRVPYDAAKAWAKHPHVLGILGDRPCTPKYNQISHTVLCGGALNFTLDPAVAASWGSEMQNNSALAKRPPWP